MVKEVAGLSVTLGLATPWFADNLQLVVRGRSSLAGKRCGKPWAQISPDSGSWWWTPLDAARVRAGAERLRPGRKRDRWLRRAVALEAGASIRGEYDSIACDPEIGDLMGDARDTLAPLAMVVCHELAHAVDYAGEPVKVTTGGHKKAWQQIYRELRNAYVASGAYKPTVAANVVPLARKKDMRLVGLPLFDQAA
jgi:hypothetical protein